MRQMLLFLRVQKLRNLSTAFRKKGKRARASFPIAFMLAIFVVGGNFIIATPKAFAATAAYHSVTFAENASNTDLIYASQTENVPTALTSFSNLNPVFVDSGFRFAGWNTAPDGTGIAYSDGSTYDFSAALILYAMWEAPYHSVTFAENATNTDPVFSSQTENAPTALTSFSNLNPVFIDSGFRFVDWNTSSDGTGVSYANGSTYDFSAALIFYAQWLPIPNVTAAFSSNGGVGALLSMSVPVGTTILLPNSTGLNRAGYVFSGWNTSVDGNGVAYSAGQTYVLNASVSFYAQWVPDVFTVIFTVSSGLTPLAPATFTVGSTPLILPTLSLTGYSFAGWFSAAIGGSLVGLGGQSYTPAGSTAIFSQWTPDAFTISFNVGNSTAPPSPVTFTYGTAPLTLPTPILSGYSFAGWFSAVLGGTLVGTGGQGYSPSASTVLYAHWTPDVFTVNYSVSNGATPQAPVTFAFGSTPLTLPTPTLAGYQFAGWFSADSGGSLIGSGGSSFSPTASTVLYGRWMPDQFVVSFVPDGGSTSEASVNYVVGSTPLVLETPTLAGDEFLGWFSAATGGNLIGAAGTLFTPTASTALYAHWSSVSTVTLSFNANGGSGSIAPISAVAGANVTVPGATGMLRAGFTLVRWNTTAHGTGVSYVPGRSVLLTNTLVLFAQWTGRAPAMLYGAVGTFALNSAHLSQSLKAQVNRLAARIVAKKFSVVELYGYTAATGLGSLNVSLSRARAQEVSRYLHTRLRELHAHPVVIRASGEGAVSGETSPSYSRVEVFVR